MAALYRFKSLPKRLKSTLVKATVLTHLTYPPIPLHVAAKSNIGRLQAIQNQALRFVHGVRWDDFITAERLHTENRKFLFAPINVVLYRRAKAVWRSIIERDGGNSERVRDILDPDKLPIAKFHKNFKSSYIHAMERPLPEPLYTANR